MFKKQHWVGKLQPNTDQRSLSRRLHANGQFSQAFPKPRFGIKLLLHTDRSRISILLAVTLWNKMSSGDLKFAWYLRQICYIGSFLKEMLKEIKH